MLIIKKELLSLVLFVLTLQLPPVSAADLQSTEDKTKWGWNGCFGFDDWDPNHLRERMLKQSATSVSVPNKAVTIIMKLDRGRIIDTPVVKESSGNAQLDFDCLQAVLADSGASHTISGKLVEIFSSSDLQKITQAQSSANDLVFYVVPLSLYDRFGAGRFFSKEELLGPDNIASIPNSSHKIVSKKAAETLKKIYCDRWAPLISEGCQPSLDQIMITRQQIRRDLEREQEEKLPLMK